MKKVLILLIIFILILIGIFYFINKTQFDKNKIKEYTPAQEIGENQLIQTKVDLYFKDKNKKCLVKEEQIISSKNLITNPYEILIKLIILGPKSDELESIIPDGTKLNNVELKNGVLYIDFSREFIDNCTVDIEGQKMIITSIVNTLVELIEVNGIKILINSEENLSFNDGVNFQDIFMKSNCGQCSACGKNPCDCDPCTCH